MKHVFVLLISVVVSLAHSFHHENWKPSLENRLLGANIAAYNYFNGFIGLTVTSTSFQTTTSTLTVGTLATCYASALFKAKTPCRRRREVMAVLSALGELEKDIEPSGVLPVESTAGVETINFSSRETALNGSSDLASSISAGQSREDVSKAGLNRFKRFTAKTTTVSATVTSYVFYTTTATSTFQTKTLAAADDLQCVPGGFKLC